MVRERDEEALSAPKVAVDDVEVVELRGAEKE